MAVVMACCDSAATDPLFTGRPPQVDPRQRIGFEFTRAARRTRLSRLIAEMASEPPENSWYDNHGFGSVTGDRYVDAASFAWRLRNAGWELSAVVDAARLVYFGATERLKFDWGQTLTAVFDGFYFVDRDLSVAAWERLCQSVGVHWSAT
jgi:hypothetical protein